MDLTEADSQEGEGEQLPPEQADGGDSEAVREEEKEEGEEALPAAGDAAQDQQQALAQAAALAEQVRCITSSTAGYPAPGITTESPFSSGLTGTPVGYTPNRKDAS